MRRGTGYSTVAGLPAAGAGLSVDRSSDYSSGLAVGLSGWVDGEADPVASVPGWGSTVSVETRLFKFSLLARRANFRPKYITKPNMIAPMRKYTTRLIFELVETPAAATKNWVCPGAVGSGSAFTGGCCGFCWNACLPATGSGRTSRATGCRGLAIGWATRCTGVVGMGLPQWAQNLAESGFAVLQEGQEAISFSSTPTTGRMDYHNMLLQRSRAPRSKLKYLITQKKNSKKLSLHLTIM
jgi:hypothetical protein